MSTTSPDIVVLAALCSRPQEKLGLASLMTVWDAATGAKIHTIEGPAVMKNPCCDVSSDGKFVLNGGADGRIMLWDAATGALLTEFSSPRPARAHHPKDVVCCCAFSPDGATVISGGAASDDAMLNLWDAATGTLLRELSGHADSVNCCAFSPGGTTVLSGSDDTSLILWNADTGKLLRKLTGHARGVICCAFSPDGTLFLSGSKDKALRLWDAATGRLLRHLSGHADKVTCCAISPGAGTTVLSGSADNTLKLWDADTTTGHIASIVAPLKQIQHCVFSPTGATILIDASYAGLFLLDVGTGDVLATFNKRRS